MAQSKIQKDMEDVYSQTFYRLLMDSIIECKELKYLDLSEKNREQIGTQAGKRSVVLAKLFVEEISKRGYLERAPTKDELGSLFKEFMAKMQPKSG